MMTYEHVLADFFFFTQIPWLWNLWSHRKLRREIHVRFSHCAEKEERNECKKNIRGVN